MTPARLREVLALLRWSRRGLGATLNRAASTIDQWSDGRARIPDDVAAWLERLAKAHEKNPPPVRNSR